jgi:GNAT superfamily N-acetyltransferase
MTLEIRELDAARLEASTAALARVLHACVMDGASVGYILPFTEEEAEGFWRGKVLPAVEGGCRIVLVAAIDGEVVGTVQLDYDTPPNQPHRAEVKKLLVHPEARRKGIARALMLAIEQRARDVGRSLLTLDTRSDDAAEPLYAGMGYVTAGRIEGWCRDTFTDRYDATTIMYKAL